MDKFVACCLIISWIILPFCYTMPRLGPSQVRSMLNPVTPCHVMSRHFAILPFCHFAILSFCPISLALSEPPPRALSPTLSLPLSRSLSPPLSLSLSLSLCRCLLIIRP